MKNILLIIVMLSFSYGEFNSIVSEEPKYKQIVLSIKPESQKEDPPVTSCSHKSVYIDDISNKVVNISIAMTCYKNSYTPHGFENCLKDNQSIVKVKRPKTSIIKSSIVPNIGVSMDGD